MLVQREADITRLLVRLENGVNFAKADPVEGSSVLARITQRRPSLLQSLQPRASRMSRDQFRMIKEDELEKLLARLDKIRSATAQMLSERDYGAE